MVSTQPPCSGWFVFLLMRHTSKHVPHLLPPLRGHHTPPYNFLRMLSYIRISSLVFNRIGNAVARIATSRPDRYDCNGYAVPSAIGLFTKACA